ncbi:MAG: RNA polymerase sigma factor [Gemmatimonadales bacterium]
MPASFPMPMPPMSQGDPRSDAELVAAYRSGDERAAAVLVHRHAQPLGRYLYGNGAAAGDLEDLVQETFFRAFRALASWRGEASFRGWLFRIGANLSRDRHRREGGRIVLALEDTDVRDSADPEAEVSAREMERRLRSGIAKLPRLQREVFLMRAQQGLEYEEISTALGTTPGAARVHYHHAVKRLKELLQ